MNRPITLVFDADCLLCSANARFVSRNDKAARFRLLSLQSEEGAAIYRRFGIDPADAETLILVEGERMRRDSDAVFAVAEGLGWPWRLAAIGRVVPPPLRDGLYRRVARNRYRLFGRSSSCVLPARHGSDA